MPLQFLSHISQTLLSWGSGGCWLAVQLPKAELFSLNKAKVPQYGSCNTSGIGESANTSFPKYVLLPLLVWNLTSIFLTFCSTLPLLPSGNSFFPHSSNWKISELKGNVVLCKKARLWEVKKGLRVIQVIRDRTDLPRPALFSYIIVSTVPS